MTRARDLADFNLDGKAVTINESSADLDFRVESNGNANMFFVDAGNDRIGIGTASPSYLIDALDPRTSDNADAVLRVKAQGTGDSDATIILDAADTGESQLLFYNAGSNESSIEWNSESPQLNIRTASGTNGPIDMQPNNVLTARFETNGDLTLEDGNLVIGTDGHGIDFSATSGTGTSELLADYEEGSWTPGFTFAGSASGIVYTVQAGNYTRIGRQVTCIFDIRLSNNGTGSGTARLTGLPFNVGNLLGNTALEGGGLATLHQNRS